MPKFAGVRVTLTGRPIKELAGDLTSDVRRELHVAGAAIADRSVAYWRGSTPIKTGRLRRSERARVEITPDGWKTTYHVKAPGSGYYEEVADKYPHLEDKEIVHRWREKHERPIIDKAIKQGIAENE